jgi:hypothetical protein
MTMPLIAGAATTDITPSHSQFLFGYPHISRYSTGVHDPLLSSALFLSDGKTSVLWVANDVIYVSRATARRVRERIQAKTGVPAAHILVTATHTHSGPLTGDMISNEADAVIPKTDPQYVEQLENGIVQAACEAVGNAHAAVLGLGIANGSCVGSNRHNPAGPSDPEVPVLIVRSAERDAFIAAMLVCNMHPTILHEDSTLISGDFPAMTRQYLQEHVLGANCPVLHHTGPCGDQSPRHVTRANTLEEATRLGHLLGQAIVESISDIQFTSDISLATSKAMVDLPPRQFPTVAEAEALLARLASRLDQLRQSKVDPREMRTAECDWFGAEETVALARAAETGRLQKAVAEVMPAEITLFRIGPWAFVGWPGEVFVEFSLKVKVAYKNCYVISMANGELQGYLVTEEAMQKNWYEATNSSFANPASGMLLVSTTLGLLHASNNQEQHSHD